MRLLSSILFLLAVLPGASAAPEARYLGALPTPDGRVLKIGVALFERADGSPWASFASPDQDAYDVPVTRFTRKGKALDLDLGWAAIKLTELKSGLKGSYTQNGERSDIELVKVAQFPQRARPQAPKAPYPYTSHALAIKGGEGVMLGATLTLPKGKHRPNLVVLVHGSGPGTRDGMVAGHEQFKVLADYLARRGLAVLRYDKRGIARSSGNYDQHTIGQLADDLAGVVDAMRARGQFGRVGVAGISEGPGVAVALEARKPGALDFLVSLSGVGLNGMEMILLQDRVYLERQNPTGEELARLLPYVAKWYQTIAANEQAEARIAALKALTAGLTPEERALVAKYKADVGTLSLDWAAKPFVHAMLLTDARAQWQAVRCPVLAIGGSLDVQVPAPENVGGIVAALHAGGNRSVESHILPSLNHLLQTAVSGGEDEYERIDETMAPAVMERIARFATSTTVSPQLGGKL